LGHVKCVKFNTNSVEKWRKQILLFNVGGIRAHVGCYLSLYTYTKMSCRTQVSAM